MIDIIVTVDMMMEKQPCPEWPRERVAAYLGEGKTLTAMLRDALADNGISIPDAIWGVTWFLPDNINRAFAIWCLRQCKTDVKEIADYIDTIERYYAGKATKDELNAADRAVYRVADEVAYRVADEVAYRVADDAADEAADRAAYRAAYWAVYRVANEVAYGAAYLAAYFAAYLAADRVHRKLQAERLIEMIDAVKGE